MWGGGRRAVRGGWRQGEMGRGGSVVGGGGKGTTANDVTALSLPLLFLIAIETVAVAVSKQ